MKGRNEIKRGHPMPNAAAHHQVADVAKSIALAMYERLALMSNEFYAKNPDPEVYAQKSWPLYTEEARTTLVMMLSGNYPEHLKEQIKEALILDEPLRITRQKIQVSTAH